MSQMNHSLAKLYARAAELDWRCLSEEWTGSDGSYLFECTNGHRFERAATQVLYKSPRCVQCKEDEVRTRWLATVSERGGTLLGTFTSLKERYRLRCAVGHEWETRGTIISEGSWCPKCKHEIVARGNVLPDGLARLRSAAAAKDGRCLANAYTGVLTYYPFECASDHCWEARGAKIFEGSWCPRCRDAATSVRATKLFFYHDGLERLHETARKRDGQCLAEEYTGSNVRYRFRCSADHEWTQTAASIWEGYWCARCAKIEQRTTIEEMHAIAASHGGKCLSQQSEGGRVKHTWECHLGHVWEAAPYNVKRGSWCPECAHIESGLRATRLQFYHDGLERLQATSQERGGVCLANEYTGSHERYRFRCAQGHEWAQTAHNIWQGLWCRKCEDVKRRRPIEFLQAMAAERGGGRCLSPQALGMTVKHTWECHRGHVWEARPHNIKHGRWCPNCAVLGRTKKRSKRKKYDVDA
ncbi:hypothetical protein BYI23_B010770 [Burkholderia sp. YI23]|nr:hypothetical protein BYI23_B010770 [Burkholderia sp. YI23]